MYANRIIRDLLKKSTFFHIRGIGLASLLVLMMSSAAIAGCGDDSDTTENFDDTSATIEDIVAINGSINDSNDNSTDDSSDENAINPIGYESVDLSESTIFAKLTTEGDTVAYVDTERYLGKWYEIATYEQAFQRNCTGTTATYSANDNGTIGVKNECYKNSLDGRYNVANAYARVVDEETNAKLKVFFFPLFGAPYWIIELDGAQVDAPYEWAVVGSSSSRYLWILSRTPQMSDERLELILNRLVERGYDIDKLSFTLQPQE